MQPEIRIIINNTSFTALLETHAAARGFLQQLPLRLEMMELNANEKYARLRLPLPASPEKRAKIQAGDLMLWGDDTVVLFYKTFTTSYRYTRLGSISDPHGLEAVVGKGTVPVLFEPA